MAQIQSEFNELPRFADIPVGQVLTIVGVETDKTQKQGYDCYTLTLEDGSQLFGTERGVLYQLGKVDTSITPESPLKVAVTEYKNQFGKMSKSIRNV